MSSYLPPPTLNRNFLLFNNNPFVWEMKIIFIIFKSIIRQALQFDIFDDPTHIAASMLFNKQTKYYYNCFAIRADGYRALNTKIKDQVLFEMYEG